MRTSPFLKDTFFLVTALILFTDETFVESFLSPLPDTFFLHRSTKGNCPNYSSEARLSHLGMATTSPTPSSQVSQQKINEEEEKQQKPLLGNVLILDHINLNHEKGRHDLLKGFYFDTLRCVPDPRKAENLESGRKTLWANVGSHQFHLPEGTPNAQVLDGMVTLAYPSLTALLEGAGAAAGVVTQDDGDHRTAMATDPWGNRFRLVTDTDGRFSRDPRGRQPGVTGTGTDDDASCFGITDVTLHVAAGMTNFAGIGRFYEKVLGAPVLECTSERCVVSVGAPCQTLSFVARDCPKQVQHEDLVWPDDDDDDDDDDELTERRRYPINRGVHLSLYVADLRSTFRRVDELGAIYVNPRFKRRAYTEAEAMDQCMFRCLDVIDPENVAAGPILRIEHEIRSVIKTDGTMYKSCPFDEIPEGCVS